MTENASATSPQPGTAANDDGRAWPSRMAAWQLADTYGTFRDLKLNDEATSPAAVGPGELVVRPTASSVNPIDVLMAEGYGKVLIGRMRQARKKSLFKPVEFPLTLGRDFVGEIVAVGAKVADKDLKVGDVVIGVVAPFEQGCHAEYVTVPETQVAKKPEHLSDEEAAGLLYAGLTAWNSLKSAGGLCASNAANKNVLVLGGSGGVGNCAVQLLKSWGAKVTTTCSTDAIDLVKSLGPDNIVDYTSEDAPKQLEQHGKYDVILDAAGVPYGDIRKYTPLLKGWSFSTFIALRSPVLVNTDSYGVFAGMMKNAYDLIVPNIWSGAVFKCSTIRWGFFTASPAGIEELARLADERKLAVPVDSVYEFADAKDAFGRVDGGHLRGKVVVTFGGAK